MDFAQAILIEDSISNVSISDQDVSEARFPQLNLSDSIVTKIDWTQVAIGRFDVLNCHLNNCDFTASKLSSSSWFVTSVDGARMSGTQITESSFKNVTFSNCKLDLVNFRFSRLHSVVFRDCMISDADFNNATLKNVEFIGCTITGISFSSARMDNVDLSGSYIENVKGVRNLKGATIGDDQLIQLAPLLAAEAGLKIK